ncbi:MAG: DUF2600 family protein [Bacillota bacterium]|jgi:tetraprenyl-beta-curcumene synthase
MERQTGALPVACRGFFPELIANLRECSVYLSMAGRIFPLAKRELKEWERKARSIPDPELRGQALASIGKKSFHSVGGAVFALLNGHRVKDLVKAIVAIQTISDYLDNLCDRACFWNPAAGKGGVMGVECPEEPADPTQGTVRSNALDAAARRFLSSMRLHGAMLCAVDPTRPMEDSYSLYPAGDDGGYLKRLAVER